MSQFHHLYNTARWRKLRAQQLRREPLCRACLTAKRTTRATVADHITAHRGNEALFWNPANLQSLCTSCHSGDKQREEKGGGQHYRGCGVDGNPLDPNHHWKAEAVNPSNQHQFGMVSANAVSAPTSTTYSPDSPVHYLPHHPRKRPYSGTISTGGVSRCQSTGWEGGVLSLGMGALETAHLLACHKS